MMTKTKIEGQFYPLTADVARTLREANLTAAEWRLWSYLVELDPWGERYSNLPDVLKIMEECDLKKSTFYKAIAKFQELELFDFQALWMSFRNLFGVPKIRNPFRENGNHSENSETIPKIRKTVRENGNHSDSSENQSLNPLLNQESSSPQTNQTVQTIHTSQIAGEREIQKITNIIKEGVASTEVLLASEINQKCASSKIVSQGQLPQPKTYSPQQINWRWLPDGPWNIDGKLDREFQEWLAKKWMAEYNRTDIYKAKADVLLHFKKDPTNLAVWWEVYQSQYIAKAENLKTRLDHGCKISNEEKQEAIANHRAVLPMSEEQQQTTKQPPVIHQPTPQLKSSTQKIEEQQLVLQGEISDPWEIAAAAEAEVAEAATTEASEFVETSVTDEEGRHYKDVTGIAARQDSDIPEEQRKKVMAKISEFISGLSQKMKIKSQPQPAEPKNDLETLNEMLLDPVFRKDSEIIGKVKQYLCLGYLADYDDAGYPISVYAF